MKALITAATLALFCATSFAQYKHWNEETKQFDQYNSYEDYVIEKAEFIFEGKMLEYKTFKNDSTKKSYSVYKI